MYNDYILSGSDTSNRSLGLGMHDVCIGLTPRALNIQKQQQRRERGDLLIEALQFIIRPGMASQSLVRTMATSWEALPPKSIVQLPKAQSVLGKRGSYSHALGAVYRALT